MANVAKATRRRLPRQAASVDAQHKRGPPHCPPHSCNRRWCWCRRGHPGLWLSRPSLESISMTVSNRRPSERGRAETITLQTYHRRALTAPLTSRPRSSAVMASSSGHLAVIFALIVSHIAGECADSWCSALGRAPWPGAPPPNAAEPLNDPTHNLLVAGAVIDNDASPTMRRLQCSDNRADCDAWGPGQCTNPAVEKTCPCMCKGQVNPPTFT